MKKMTGKEGGSKETRKEDSLELVNRDKHKIKQTG